MKPPSAPAPDPRTPSEIEACRAALRALAEGRLDEWRGLHGCRRADADAVFGARVEGDFAGLYGALLHYRPQPAAPHGIDVTLDDDGIWIIEIVEPRRVVVS